MRLKLLLWAAIVLNAIAAFAPFRFDPSGMPRIVHNRLASQQHGTLVFHPPSMARSTAAPSWIDDAKRMETLFVRLRVIPGITVQEGPARILTISNDYKSRDLMIGQQGTNLIVRVRRPESDANGVPSFVVPGVFEAGRTRDIAVLIRPGRFIIQIDGKTRMRRPLQSNALEGWDSTYRLALGNEVCGLRAWDGVIQRAVIVTPRFRDDLLAPGRLEVPKQWWQIPDGFWNSFYVQLPDDGIVALLHLLAFAPVGYAAARLAARHGRRRWVMMVMILVFAAVIEILKVFFAGRHPSVLNLMANIVGCLVGTIFSGWWVRRNASARLRASNRYGQ